MICNVLIELLLIEHIFQHTFIYQEWIVNNGNYNNVKDYCKKNVGYHTAICIALNTLNQNKVSKKYADFIKLRVDADYNIITIINSEDAQKALDLAFQIQNALQ
jgi:hypothetical protein